MDSAKNMGRSSYLDLLIAVLKQHEKALDEIVEKMEKLSGELSRMNQRIEVAKEKSRLETVTAGPKSSDTLIYMKIRIDRPLDEVIRIVEALKE